MDRIPTRLDQDAAAASHGRVEIHFSGPFAWHKASDAPSLFDEDIGKSQGIYLWTIPLPEGHLIHYVGETGRSFSIRMLEHYKEHALCMYHLHDPVEFAQGRRATIWPGRYDANCRKTPLECIAQYSRLASVSQELARMYRFFLGAFASERRARCRVEAAIASALYTAPEPAATFLDRGVRYVHRKTTETPLVCAMTSDVPLIGLPPHVLA